MGYEVCVVYLVPHIPLPQKTEDFKHQSIPNEMVAQLPWKQIPVCWSRWIWLTQAPSIVWHTTRFCSRTVTLHCLHQWSH